MFFHYSGIYSRRLGSIRRRELTQNSRKASQNTNSVYPSVAYRICPLTRFLFCFIHFFLSLSLSLFFSLFSLSLSLLLFPTTLSLKTIRAIFIEWFRIIE